MRNSRKIYRVYISSFSNGLPGVFIFLEKLEEREREVFVGFLGQGATVIDL